jgi:hypothetical protein
MTAAPSVLTSKFPRYALLGSVIGTALTAWILWPDPGWLSNALVLHAIVAIWVLALWRAGWPDMVGALCTVPALGVLLIGALQMSVGSLSAGSTAGAVAAAAVVGAARLARERLRHLRRLNAVISLLHDLNPQAAQRMLWTSTRTEVLGSCRTGSDQDPHVREAAALLRRAGADPVITSAYAETSSPVLIRGRVRDVPVQLRVYS